MGPQSSKTCFADISRALKKGIGAKGCRCAGDGASSLGARSTLRVCSAAPSRAMGLPTLSRTMRMTHSLRSSCRRLCRSTALQLGTSCQRKGRQNEMPINEGPLHAGHPAHYHQQYQPHMQQHAASQHLHFPSYFDMWPAHAAAVSQAFGANLGLGANGMGVRGMRHHDQNGSAAATSHAGDAAASAFQSSINMSAYQMAGLPVLQPLSGMQSATAAAKPDAISVSAPPS